MLKPVFNCLHTLIQGNAYIAEHQNYFGTDENIGPVAISIKREKVSPTSRLLDSTHKCVSSASSNSKHNTDSSTSAQYQYRVIVRTSEVGRHQSNADYYSLTL